MTDTTGPGQTLNALRRRAPLVHNITNLVAMDIATNLLLAAGALPAMIHNAQEVRDVVAEADALTINIGTLSANWLEPMVAAARTAVDLGKPWVLDPVGGALSTHRGEVAQRLAHLQPNVIRGNGTAIMALALNKPPAPGGDLQVDSTEALDAAYELAKATGAVVAVTGAVDYVIDGKDIVAVANGHPLMARVAGLDCALTCLVGACCAVGRDAMSATVHALAIMGLCGELAAAQAQGPASFRTRLIDTLYNLDAETLTQGARIQ